MRPRFESALVSGDSGAMGSGDMGGMSGCPCMQMQNMMMNSPIGWIGGTVMAAFAIALIVALVTLTIFLIRHSRPIAAH